MIVICQNGTKAEFKTITIGGVFSNCVIGTKDGGNKYTIGKYRDAFTALTVVSKIIQHDGKRPYKMPGEDYEVK